MILLSRDYEVLTEFTLALFEDSGWYKVNYTALYDLKQNPLQWGKGKDVHIRLNKLNGLQQAWAVHF